MLPSLVLALASAGLQGQADAPPQLHVSALNGDDARGDGGRDAPFRSLTRALGALGEKVAPGTRIHLGYGTYDAEHGERFPLELPSGVTVRGIGASGTELVGDGQGTLLRLGGAGQSVLGGLSLRGADVGLELTGGQAASVHLLGLRVEGLETGVGAAASDAGGPALSLWIDGLQAVDCGVGLALTGHGPVGLELRDSAFRDCRVGLLFEAAAEAEIAAYEGPGVDHDVTLAGCVFRGCSEAGILRRGAARTNEGPAYRFEACLFEGNRAGIEFRRPAADSPLVLRGCRFLSNTHFGLTATGHDGDAGKASEVVESEFRFNGVGLHVTNAHVVYRVHRNRFLDNGGNAMFLSNFMTEPVRAVVANNLVAANGGAGVYCLADGRQLAVALLYNTIVDNGGGGVVRKNRHSGQSSFEVRGCILAGNTPELVKIEPAEVFGSLVMDGSAGRGNGNLEGDPAFLDPARRDYRLGPESPCRDAGAADPRLGAVDLAGAPRAVGPPDLGALEAEAPR